MRSDRDHSHRSALWLSTMLTLAGSCGACNGAQIYAAPPPQSPDLIDTATGPGAHEIAEVAFAFRVTSLDAQSRRPMAAANLVVSLMLVVGSFMLGSRSAHARWFVVNALAANLVWIVADVGFAVAQIESRRAFLAQKVARWMLAIETPQQPITDAQARAWSHGSITMIGVALVTVALAKLAFHAFLIARTRSDLITAFLADRSDE